MQSPIGFLFFMSIIDYYTLKKEKRRKNMLHYLNYLLLAHFGHSFIDKMLDYYTNKS
jgi:hypothetical protein